MDRYHFIIVGSGWRAMYYVRVAKAMPELFCLDAMYCRRQEKADKIAQEYGINTVTSIDDCINMRPDFAVIAVSKASICDTAIEWMDRGMTVLSETPAGLDTESLFRMYEYNKAVQKQVVAEQYREYPHNKAVIRLVKSGIIGDVSCMNISLAHEYHGASLMRAYLGINPGMKYSLTAKNYTFPTTETLTRYERYTDGRIADKKRCVASFEFENGKVAWYDFDSEQYRSPIRKNTYKIQGTRGEIIDDKVYYLDENNNGAEADIDIKTRIVNRGDVNPNFAVIREVESISFQGKVLYQPAHGLCGLSEDETAIAALMEKTALYSRGMGPSPYSIEDALADAYAMIRLNAMAKVDKPVGKADL